MEAETIVWLLIMLVWFAASIIKQVRGMGKDAPKQTPPLLTPSLETQPAAPPVPSRPASSPQDESPGRAVQVLLSQLGLDVVAEQPVASEHQRTLSEHRQTASEHRQTASEHAMSFEEHRQAASEVSVTAEEHRRTPSEHIPTASEHRPGDLTRGNDRSLAKAYVERGRSRSALGREVRRELLGNRRSLAKAWLLRELLGPPPGLGPQGRETR